MRGARRGGLTVLTLLAGCSSLVPSPAATIKAPYTLPPPTPTIGPISTVAPSRPGQPYTADLIAAAWAIVPRDFPPRLRSDAIAAAIADAIWTYDGRRYRELLFSGSCDEDGRRCDLTAVGLPAFSPNRDASDSWSWSVDPANGVLTSAGASLNGFPPDLVPELDLLARSLDRTGRIQPLDLLGATWIAPDGYFALRYGHGLEEADPTTTVILDRDGRQILSMTTS